MSGTITHKMLELHEKYGSVVRLAPGELTYITPGAWRDIYTSRRGQEPMSPNPLYGIHEKEFFGALSLLWQEDNQEHARHRRIMSGAFSDKSLREQEPIINSYVSLLMRRLRERAGTTVDMWAFFNFATFDIIGDLTFGEPFDCLQDCRFHPWIHFLFSRLKMMMYGQIVATMGYLGYVVVEFFVPRRVKDEALRHVASTKDKVDRRRARVTDRPDFMTHILSHTGDGGGGAAAEGSGGKLSLAELYADSQILVIAGSETSATLLAAAVYYLLRNPEALQALEREIRSAFQSEADIRFATVSHFPYLLAVINESLRVQPPLPSGIHRIVGRGGAFIDGAFVAAGTDVHVPHWAAYRCAANFRDPHRFVPERWLPPGAGADERYADDNRDTFQPFSLGQRNCVGRSLAYMETCLILSRLIWNFDMELMPESRDWADQKVYLLYEKRPLNVRLTPVGR